VRLTTAFPRFAAALGPLVGVIPSKLVARLGWDTQPNGPSRPSYRGARTLGPAAATTDSGSPPSPARHGRWVGARPKAVQQHAPGAPSPAEASELRSYYRKLDPDRFPSTRAAARALTGVSARDEFLEGLQFILDGVEPRLTGPGTTPA
jgi:hypothetical protein